MKSNIEGKLRKDHTAAAPYALGSSPADAPMAGPDDHAAGSDLCVEATFTPRQALVMARGFAARGLVDLSEGCIHYGMPLMARGAQGLSA